MQGARTGHRQQTALVVAVGVLVAATVYGDYASGMRGGLLALEVAVGVVACCLPPVLLRWPVTAALALAALALIGPTATPPATAGTFLVARHRPFRVAVGVAGAGIVAHALRGLWLPIGGLPYQWWLLLVVIGHAGLVGWGALSATRQALIATLRERAQRAEAEQGRRVAEGRAAERARIAREMHDVLAHRLSLLATYAGALEYRPDHPPQRLAQAAGVIRASAHQALDELREVITLLHADPAGRDPQRPVPALADLPALVEESRAIGTPVQVRDTLTDPAILPDSAGRAAYRVVQEALTNARKHAPGQPVSITLDGTPGTRLYIEVHNPLAQLPATQPTMPGAGTGLVGLTERVRLAGGQLDHHTTGDTFRLHAWLPWPVWPTPSGSSSSTTTPSCEPD